MFDTAGDFEIASELLIHRPQTHTPQPRLRRGQSLALALFFMSHTKTHMSSAARVTLQQRTQALAPWVTRTRSNMPGGWWGFHFHCHGTGRSSRMISKCSRAKNRPPWLPTEQSKPNVIWTPSTKTRTREGHCREAVASLFMSFWQLYKRCRLRKF